MESAAPHDLTDPSINLHKILADAHEQDVMNTFEREHAQLMAQTESFDSDPAQRRLKAMLMDIESLRTLGNHEFVSGFFEAFRDTFTGDPNTGSYEEREARARMFIRSPKYDALQGSQLWNSAEAFLDMARSLHVVRMYGWASDGLTEPHTIPVWIIGRETEDNETAEYLAVSLEAALPEYAANFRTESRGYNKWVHHKETDDNRALHRAYSALDNISYKKEYDSERLFSVLSSTFGIFSFHGPVELPALAKQFTAEDLGALSRQNENQPRQYDIRPRAMVERIDNEALPLARDAEWAQLTDDTMQRMDVRGHLSRIAESRSHTDATQNLTDTLDEKTDVSMQKRITRERVYQKSVFPELHESNIPEQFAIPSEWREEGRNTKASKQPWS